MIVIRNRKMVIPYEDVYIGTSYDTNTEIRMFKVQRYTSNHKDLSALNFRLDLRYNITDQNAADTVMLSKEVHDDYILLKWEITESVLQAPGTAFINLRATENGTNRWSTFIAAVYIGHTLYTPGSYTGSLTEIEQMEADFDHFKQVIEDLEPLVNLTDTAEAWAVGQRNGHDVSSSDITYHNNAKYYSGTAMYAAADSENFRNLSQAYAEGKIGSQDVDSDDPAYHNNAKYYRDNAATSASLSVAMAETAEAWAEGEINDVPVDSSHPAYHNNAKYYAEQASYHSNAALTFSGNANDFSIAAAASASAAANSAENAAASEDNAESYASAAQASDASAATAASNSEAWAVGQRNGTNVGSSDSAYHNNAKYYAEQADASSNLAGVHKDAAQTAAQQAAASATSAAGSALDASDYADQAAASAASLTVDTALSDTSTNPVQNKIITGELSDVKTAIDVTSDAVKITGNYERVSAGGYTTGAYVSLVTKSITTGQGNSLRLYDPIPVSAGEVYKITCSGYGTAAAYAFASDETTIVDAFPRTYRNTQPNIYTDELIVIPSGVAYLYVERNTQVTEVTTSVKKIIAPDYVKYTAQELTEEQMQIARANINAANADVEDTIGLIGDGCDTVLNVTLETGGGNRTPGETFVPTTATTYRRKRFVPKTGVIYKIGTKTDYAVDANAHIIALDSNDVILAQYGIYADVIGVLNETYVSFDSTVASVVVIARTTHNYIYLTECASVSDVYDNPVVGLLPIAKYNDESVSAKKVATWLWFTDIHGDATSAKAINEFYSNNITQIVDVLNSGDVVLDVGTDSIADVMAYNACKKALFVVGNHDSSTKINDVRDWDGLSSAECYDKFIAPYVENWGTVVFGGTGLCYYYKDYASLGLRLIALDQSHWDATQKEWLATTLASAQSSNYSVLILSHYLPESTTGIPCNMTNYAAPNADYSYYTLGGGDAGAIIQDWIDGGGKFIMWVCGHSHRDRLGCCAESNDITVRQLTKASPDRTHDEYRDGKYRNAFELMTIDLNNGLVKFQRIGCNTDMWLTKKNVLVYDYIGHKVVTQF